MQSTVWSPCDIVLLSTADRLYVAGEKKEREENMGEMVSS